MSKELNNMNILSIVNGLPTKRNPYRWVHVIEQMEEIGKICWVIIISPRKKYLPFRRHHLEDEEDETLTDIIKGGKVTYYQPKYFDVPRLVWTILKSMGVKNIPGWVYYLKDISIYLTLVSFIIWNRISFDVIHAHFAYWPGYVGSLLSKLFRKKFILTVHGSDIEPSERTDIDESKRDKRIIETLSSATAITAVSKKIADKISSLGTGLREKVEVIPMGVNRRLFSRMEQKACLKKLGLKDGKKYLLFIGNLVPVKGPDLLIEAYRLVHEKRSDIDLIIVGNGLLYDVLKAMVKEYGIEGSVHFIGGVPHEDVLLYLNAADLLVVPSRNEGRAVVIMEALACGRPVVAFDVGGIRETLNEKDLGILVPAQNVDALSESILIALEQKWQAETLCRAVEGYYQDRIAQEYVRKYKQVLSVW
jgi:glycosyltransferase involved in cell wall biosynthesis